VNIDGDLGGQKYFPVVFKSDVKNKRKIKENGNFYVKSVYSKIDVGFWCNS